MFMQIFGAILLSLFFQALSQYALAQILSSEVERTFENGLIVMGLASLAAIVLYLHVPVLGAPNSLKEHRKQLFFKTVVSVVIALIILSMIADSEAGVRDAQAALAVAFFFAGGVFLLIAVCHSLVRYIFELRERNVARKKHTAFDIEPPKYYIQYAKHLEMVRCLALINDDSKTSKYIKDYLNGFEDYTIGDSEKLSKLDDQPLAAYLYVKMRQIKAMGFGGHLNIWNFDTNSKIKTYKLMDAIDILVDEVMESIDKDKSFIRINIRKEKDGSPSIEVCR